MQHRKMGGIHLNDVDILDLYWSRNEQAIAETEKSYGKYCFSIAFRILRDREDSDECVNDTWLRAWNAIPPGRPARLSLFLGTITRNLSFDKWKSKRARTSGEFAQFSTSNRRILHDIFGRNARKWFFD